MASTRSASTGHQDHARNRPRHAGQVRETRAVASRSTSSSAELAGCASGTATGFTRTDLPGVLARGATPCISNIRRAARSACSAAPSGRTRETCGHHRALRVSPHLPRLRPAAKPAPGYRPRTGAVPVLLRVLPNCARSHDDPGRTYSAAGDAVVMLFNTSVAFVACVQQGWSRPACACRCRRKCSAPTVLDQITLRR